MPQCSRRYLPLLVAVLRAVDLRVVRFLPPFASRSAINATIPKGTEPGDVTMDMAVSLIAEREAKGGKKRTTRKSTARKTATSKGK